VQRHNENIPLCCNEHKGDGAYVETESMMCPFPGINLHLYAVLEEAFNFWFRQIRVTIERTFGIFIQRWGIFWKPLRFNIPLCFEIIHA
jgi:hypothetical protein